MEKIILAEMPIAASCDADTLDFNTLVCTYGRFVMSVAYAVVRNSEDAEDVAQETFFRAFRSGNLGKIENMKAWLGRIAWRLALNRSRNRSRDQQMVRPGDLLRTFPARETGAEELLIRKERAVLLDRMLLSLPHDLSEAFILLMVEGMTSRSAAEILGIPESSVRNRLLRARELMKAKLAALMEESNES
ncbi:MAG: sigma-24, subfamily [Acidobacteria bacterium]|nr:sigma-24, subfamily [Acidobacteriota bacterium]